jgi:hypothetical protein
MLRRPLPLLLACVALIAGGVAAGCGSSSGSSGSGLTAMVPREALAYFEVTLRPSGAARDDALAAAGKLLNSPDPAARIRGLLQQGFAKADPPVNYARDIDPWLGDRAALWVGTPGASGTNPPVGAIVTLRDEDLARKKLGVLAAKDGKPVKRSVDGEDYEVYPGSNPAAVAFRDGELLVGTEPAVRRMLTLADDASLAAGSAYRQATSVLDATRLATIYIDSKRLLDYSMRSNPQAARQFAPLRRLIDSDALRPAVGELTADATSIAVEFIAKGARAGTGALSPLSDLTGATLLKSLPADSWAAMGVPKLGLTLKTSFNQIAGGFGGAAVRAQIQQRTGLDLDRDVFSWMGDVGFFARGSSPTSIDGGVVIKVTDRARAASAFGKFVGLARIHGLDPKPTRIAGAASAFAVRMPHAPKPIVLARGGDRMVLAFGVDAAAQGIVPDRRLEQGPSYAKAAVALGNGFTPSMLFSFPPIVSLVDASGDTSRGWSQARQYLQNLAVLALGTKVDGDTARSRFALAFR